MEPSSKKMTTRQKSLKNFYQFHHTMEQNDVILVYAGEFSQELTKTLLAFTEKKFSIDELEDLVKRKIFNIMVEMLQNISKNMITDEIDGKYSPLFLIGEAEKHYTLLSSNKILNANIPKIKNRIDEVNSLDAAGLKQLYKQVRLGSSFSKVGGAGIGFIDMARKSGHKLMYKFQEITPEFSTFSLLITVSKSYK